MDIVKRVISRRFFFRRRLISLLINFTVFLFFILLYKKWFHSKENIYNYDVLKSFNVESSVNITQNKVQICNNKNVCSFWGPGYWRKNQLQKEHIYYNVKTIKVPMGMNVFLITQNEKRLSIYMGITICSYQDVCNFVAKLKISGKREKIFLFFFDFFTMLLIGSLYFIANLRLALDQIAQFSKSLLLR